MNVLLSIKPEFAQKILSGRKKYEFRKTRIRKASSADNVVLYASSPTQRIVGTFEIDQIISGSPEKLWDQYSESSGIDDRKRFMDYFSGRQEGFAIEISNPQRFPTPIDPTEYINGFTPPMSFRYINESFAPFSKRKGFDKKSAGD